MKNKKISEKVFVNGFSNVILGLIVISIFMLSFSGQISLALSTDIEQPFYHGDTAKNNVSLMVNVYEGDSYVQEMLQILADHDVKATFFLGGLYVAKNDRTVKLIHMGGHEIGNHGYHHLDHKKISLEKNLQEISVTNSLIESVIGAKPILFAPPSGSFNNTTLRAAYDNNCKTIMWSKDTIDWRDHDVALIIKRATKDLKNGDLILMHPTKESVAALKEIILQIKQKGFNVVTVGENIGLGMNG